MLHESAMTQRKIGIYASNYSTGAIQIMRPFSELAGNCLPIRIVRLSFGGLNIPKRGLRVIMRSPTPKHCEPRG